jgi:hypothetical protein
MRHLEIEKWDRCGAIMGRLSRGVNDQVRLQFLHEGQDGFAIADVDRLVAVIRNLGPQLPEHPACVALGSEEDGSMVIVDSRDRKSQLGERARHLRAD